MSFEQHHLECQCTSFDHVVRVTLDPEDGEVWIDVRLNPHVSLWKRLWLALRYVVGRSSPGYGNYEEMVLREDDYFRLHDLLDRSILLKQRAAHGSPYKKPVLLG